MTSYNNVNALGLRFFASMTASISHEIKNSLAIINENGGLLGDLVMLSEKGRPLDPGRLKTLSENILRQVQRADDIVRRLNRFAHSANQPVVTTDTREIFECTVALASRLAAMNSVTITVAQQEAIQLHFRPFVVENLLWLCLKHMFTMTTGEQTVVLGAESEETDIVLSLQCSEEIPVEQLEKMVASEAQPLVFYLRAQVQGDARRQQLRIKMPKKFME